MKVNNGQNRLITAILTLPGRGLCALAVPIALACMPSSAQSPQDKSNHYRQVNLGESHRLFGSLAPVIQPEIEGDQKDDD